MRASSLFRIVFILYCFEAGTLLLFAPWSQAWDPTMANLPFELLHNLAVLPLVRGAISGFGLVHMVWATHDLEALLTRRKPHVPTDV